MLHSQGPQDLEDDITAGFQLVHGWDVDNPEIGVKGIIKQIQERMGGIDQQRPVYLSVDIDIIDPSMAPGSETCLSACNLEIKTDPQFSVCSWNSRVWRYAPCCHSILYSPY